MPLPGMHLLALRGFLGTEVFCSEAFVVVAMTLFMPVALEQYARDNGRATPDLVTPCNDSTVDSDAGCKVYLGGRWTDTTSFRRVLSECLKHCADAYRTACM